MTNTKAIPASAIDRLLLSCCGAHWRKVARIMGQTSETLEARGTVISGGIAKLMDARMAVQVRSGKLEAKGNVTHYTPVPRTVAYVVASMIAITSSAHACSGARDIMKPIAKGDWAGALKLADNCVAEDRAASPAPGSVTTDALLAVANVNFWEQGRAILNAKLQQQKPAEEALQRAVQWAQQYSLDNAFGLPIVPLTDATRGYLAEQRGDQSMAVQNYNSADAAYPDVASSRLALIAFDTGDKNGADVQAETIVKKDPEEPTALYVLGRLADQRNAPHAAVKFYEQALKGIAEAAAGNPSYPLKYMEQDRIIKALAADRLR